MEIRDQFEKQYSFLLLPLVEKGTNSQRIRLHINGTVPEHPQAAIHSRLCPLV